ncbi:unnamed protein product [Anisakis simplex]|uniref:RRM domain-containing protein n=1 Tax=Anisakis simplex TaxID=6269 RepID=A0A0M3K6Y4_ANISI|nr:unnamed protein product [Anisakis simplex]
MAKRYVTVAGLEVADVVIDKEPGGRPSGEAFVRLASKQHAEMALERNRKNMGTRYVEVFRSSIDEMDNAHYNATAGRGGIFPPPKGEPIPLRGLMTAGGGGGGGGYRERYGGYGAGGPMRGPVSRGRPSPYELPYDRYSRYGSSSAAGGYGAGAYGDDPEFDDELSTKRSVLMNLICGYIELFSGANVPPPQRYVTYRRIGGTGGAVGASYGGGRFGGGLGAGGAGPSPLTRSSGYTSFEGETTRLSLQYYNDEYEGRQSGGGYSRHWGGSSSVKAAW